MAPSPSCLFPPPSAPIPLLLTMLHIINQLWVGLPCKYPNESSFIKWLNGPDKSPNEEINNSVIVTLLILIRPSCSALIPAKRRPFFTTFSSACQHCCRFFSFLEALWWIVCCCLLFLGKMKRHLQSVRRCDAETLLPWRTSFVPLWFCFTLFTLLNLYFSNLSALQCSPSLYYLPLFVFFNVRMQPLLLFY